MSLPPSSCCLQLGKPWPSEQLTRTARVRRRRRRWDFKAWPDTVLTMQWVAPSQLSDTVTLELLNPISPSQRCSPALPTGLGLVTCRCPGSEIQWLKSESALQHGVCAPGWAARRPNVRRRWHACTEGDASISACSPSANGARFDLLVF